MIPPYRTIHPLYIRLESPHTNDNCNAQMHIYAFGINPDMNMSDEQVISLENLDYMDYHALLQEAANERANERANRKSTDGDPGPSKRRRRQ